MEKWISGAFCLLIGTGGLWTGLRQLRNRAALNLWPTTKGKVIERGTYQTTFATLSKSAFRHAPLVKYVYQVAGQEFVNDRIRPKQIQLPEHSTKRWAQKRAASFADEVTVHYNPADPSDSFILQTAKSTLYIVVGVSCLVLVFGVIFLLTQ